MPTLQLLVGMPPVAVQTAEVVDKSWVTSLKLCPFLYWHSVTRLKSGAALIKGLCSHAGPLENNWPWMFFIQP